MTVRKSIVFVACAVFLPLLACTLSDVVGFGPTAIPTSAELTPGSNAIAGKVWHDLCASQSEWPPLPETPPSGCVESADASGFVADGILDENEIGIGGVEVLLGEGTCPSIGYREVLSGADGFYFFGGLHPGTYCVSIDPSSTSNSSLLLPGWWTSPQVTSEGEMISVTITIAEADLSTEVSFGWDYQALPVYQAPDEPVPTTPPATESVSSTDTPEVTVTATVTSTPAGTPTATLPATDPRSGLGAPDFQDSFATGSNWPLYADDHASFEVGEDKLIMTAFNPDYWSSWMLASPTATDFYLEMRATIGTCSGLDAYGLMVRAKYTDVGYVGFLIGVSCDGRYSIRIWDGSAYTRLVNWTAHGDLASGSDQMQRVGVWAEGEALKLYVEGKLIAQVTDSTYTSGRFGVFVGAVATANVEVRVDEIQLWNLP